MESSSIKLNLGIVLKLSFLPKTDWIYPAAWLRASTPFVKETLVPKLVTKIFAKERSVETSTLFMDRKEVTLGSFMDPISIKELNS